MSLSKLEVTDVDNRSGEGPEGFMFGFVYFNDGTRAAYATGHGVTDGTGGWLAVTSEHQRIGTLWLDQHFPGWDVEPKKETVQA